MTVAPADPAPVSVSPAVLTAADLDALGDMGITIREGRWYSRGPDGRDARIGVQVPRIFHGIDPASASTSAGEDVEQLADDFGLTLYPWQRWYVRELLRERPDGSWAAMTAGLVVPRQNGKTLLALLRMLAGVLIFGDRLVVYSAHQDATNEEVMGALVELLERGDPDTEAPAGYSPKIARWLATVQGFRTTRRNGHHGVIFGNGARIRFVARSEGKGRGFTGDLLIFDEAGFKIPATITAGLVPALSSRPNPQVIYMSSSGTTESNSLLKVREQARSGAPGMIFAEWSSPQRFDDPTMPEDPDPDDEELWWATNPLLGYRLTVSWIRDAERRQMTSETFARERLGIWGRPPDRDSPLDVAAWMRASRGPDMRLDSVTALGIDVSRSRKTVASVACGPSSGDRLGVTLLDLAPSGRDAEARIAAAARRYRVPVVVPAYGPARPYVERLRSHGIEVVEMRSGDAPTACANLADRISTGDVEHAGQDELDQAVTDAQRRWIGQGRWAFDLVASETDPTPLWATAAVVWHLDQLDAEDDTRPSEVNSGVS